jgi:hypothetical protein
MVGDDIFFGCSGKDFLLRLLAENPGGGILPGLDHLQILGGWNLSSALSHYGSQEELSGYFISLNS